MAKKIYAVRNGKTVGLFYTWDECKESVDGFSGAEYKSFATEAEAKVYLGGKASSPTTDVIENIEDPDGVVAYVDGSYDDKQQKYAFGCVLITPNGSVIKEAGCGSEPDGIAIHNVAGELLGALHATKWAINNGFAAIDIRHDYEGIAKWVTGEWKAKNKITQIYADEMGKMKGSVKVTFTKVAAHSNNKYNDVADRLAKEALKTGKKVRMNKSDMGLTAEGIEATDLEVVIELVKEDYPEVQEVASSIPYGKRIELFIPGKDRVVITYYESKRLVINGKPKSLFASVISYVTELVDTEQIPEIFNTTFNIVVNKEQVKTEFQCLLPYSHDKLTPKMSRSLHQAVYNLNINGDLYDGTFLVQPAFRVLEGHLKKILSDNQILLDVASIKVNGFNMFEKERLRYQLKPDKMGIATPDIARYIGNCYTYYHTNRHTLSHWDDPTISTDTTKLIDVNTAHDLIRKTLFIIDEYYKLVG